MYQPIWNSFYNVLKLFKWNGEIVNKVFPFSSDMFMTKFIFFPNYLCKNKDLFLEVIRQLFQRSVLCGELHLRKDKPPRFIKKKMHCGINNHIEFSFL